MEISRNNWIIGPVVCLSLLFGTRAVQASTNEEQTDALKHRIEVGKRAPRSEKTKKAIKKIWDNAIKSARVKGCFTEDYSDYNQLIKTYNKIKDDPTLVGANYISVDPEWFLPKEKGTKTKETDAKHYPPIQAGQIASDNKGNIFVGFYGRLPPEESGPETEEASFKYYLTTHDDKGTLLFAPVKKEDLPPELLSGKIELDELPELKY